MLSANIRPTSLDEIVGQDEIVAVFRKFVERRELPHALFFGPAGCGKTTLAKVVASKMNHEFFELDGANLKTEEIRKILARFDGTLFKPLLFVDEFHRLSKTQQESLLIPLENDRCVLFGATTENPKFAVSSGIRSRVLTFEFKALTQEDLAKLLEILQAKFKFDIDADAREFLAHSSYGDARSFVNLLHYALLLDSHVTKKTLQTLRSNTLSGEGAKSSDTHYELASALIKSLRGSDVDASLYYLARLIAAGEDAAFLARRLVIFASEDVGNANPNALNIAVNAMSAVSKIGYPEARITLAQAVIYLASSPKSNAAYTAINAALKFVSENPPLAIPRYLINTDEAKSRYLYPHDFGGWVEQEYTSKPVEFYKSNGVGFEATLDAWLEKLKRR